MLKAFALPLLVAAVLSVSSLADTAYRLLRLTAAAGSEERINEPPTIEAKRRRATSAAVESSAEPPNAAADPAAPACPRPNEIRQLQVYHISKCGGTNARRVLRSALRLEFDNADYEDRGVWRREQENVPDHRYGKFANSPVKREAFIVGLVRNPFGYYRSLYSMLVDGRMYQEQKEYMSSGGTNGRAPDSFCGFSLAMELNKTDIFVGRPEDELLRSRSSFAAFVELLIKEGSAIHKGGKLAPRDRRRRGLHACKGSPEDMQGRHDDLMKMNGGIMAYDAVVRQEDYYPSMRRALETFDSCPLPEMVAPRGGGKGVDFDALGRMEMSGRRHMARKNTIQGEESSEAPPDYCFYTPELRRLVEENDGEMMGRYGYSWESFLGDGDLERDCGNVII